MFINPDSDDDDNNNLKVIAIALDYENSAEVQKYIKDLDFHRSKNLFSIHHYPMIVIFENKK